MTSTDNQLRLGLLAGLALCAAVATTNVAAAQTKIRVGWCTSVLTTGVTPFAVAEKLGWFEDEGLEVEIVNFAGSSDCIRNVATGEVLVAVPSPEPVANLSLQGVDAKIFYTAFRRNIFGLAVPADSPIKDYKDLKGKKIGVTSMASTGVLIARSVASSAGLDPDRDINIVVSGQPAQTAALLQKGEVDAVSQWDTNYTLISRAGVPMRTLEDEEIRSFPANSFVALADTIASKRDLLVSLTRAYTMAAIYAIENPKSATQMFQEVYPQVVPTGLDAESALERQTDLLVTVVEAWKLGKPSEKWGESDGDLYQRYFDWLVKWDVLKEPVSASDLTTNALVDEINRFDTAMVEKALAAQ